MLKRVEVVHLSFFVRVRSADEYKLRIILDRAFDYLEACLQTVIAVGVHIIASRCDADDKLVRVPLLRLLEAVILRGLLEGMHLVTDRQVAVERIVKVRVGGQCLDAHRAFLVAVSVFKGAVSTVREAVVLDLKLVRILKPSESDRVDQVIKGLQSLLLGSGHDVELRPASPIEKGQAEGQRGYKGCLAVLSRHEDKGFLVSPLRCSVKIKTHKVVDDEHLPGLKDKRLIHKRLAVKRFALAMDKDLVDDADHEVRLFRMKIKFRVFAVSLKPLAGKDDLSADYLLSAENLVNVLLNDRQEARLFSHRVLTGLRRVRTSSAASALPHSVFSARSV